MRQARGRYAPSFAFGRSVTDFTLVPEGKYVDQIGFHVIAIKGHIASLAKGDDQLAHWGTALDGTPDQGRSLEFKQGLLDNPTGPLGRLR